MKWFRKRRARKRGMRKVRSGRFQPAETARHGRASGWAELDRQTASASWNRLQGMK